MNFLLKFKRKVNQILLWAASAQFPLISFQNSKENQSDSALGCPSIEMIRFQNVFGNVKPMSSDWTIFRINLYVVSGKFVEMSF